jgi:uncharacterized protein with HEPN domain
MRREELYLADIIEAADAISSFLQGTERADFLGNDLVRSAVLQKLLIIGEAAARLPKDFRGSYAGIPWSDIVAFRNIAVHAYFSVDWGIVWVAATKDVPELRHMVAEILASEYPEQR